MTRKMKTIDEILYTFTVKTLPKTKRDTSYKDINKTMKLLYDNEATLPTPQGGRHNGNIGIVMTPMLYTTLTTMAWTNPPYPGLYPAIPTNATAALRNQLQLQHENYKESIRIWGQWMRHYKIKSLKPSKTHTSRS